MEAEDHILKQEKDKMDIELGKKQAIIEAQTTELEQLRADFDLKAKEASENADQFRKVVDGLPEKVATI